METSQVEYAGYSTRILRTRGPRGQSRFVFFHGYCDSADTWRETMQLLASRGWSATAVDLPGLGDADDLRPGPVLPQLREFATAVITSESEDGPVIAVGNSLGSCSVLLATSSGAPVVGVVATAEPTLGTSPLIGLFRARRMGLVLHLARLSMPVPARVVRRLTPRAFRHAVGAGRVDAEVAARVAANVIRLGGPARIVVAARGLALESVNCYDLSELTAPVLIVHGGRDAIIPVNAAEALHRMLPSARLVIEPRWGHCPQLDHPHALAELLQEFAESLEIAQSAGET